MDKVWIKNGKLIVDDNGSPIVCDECPCATSSEFITFEWGGYYLSNSWATLYNAWSGELVKQWYGRLKRPKEDVFRVLSGLSNRQTYSFGPEPYPDDYHFYQQFQDYVYDEEWQSYRNSMSQGQFYNAWDLTEKQTCVSYITSLSSIPPSAQSAQYKKVNDRLNSYTINILRVDEQNKWRIIWPWHPSILSYPGGEDVYWQSEPVRIAENLPGNYLMNNPSWIEFSSNYDISSPLSSVWKFIYVDRDPTGRWTDAQDEAYWYQLIADFEEDNRPIAATIERAMGLSKSYDTGHYASIQILDTSTDNGFSMYDQNQNIILPKGRCDLNFRITPGQLRRERDSSSRKAGKTDNSIGTFHSWLKIT